MAEDADHLGVALFTDDDDLFAQAVVLGRHFLHSFHGRAGAVDDRKAGVMQVRLQGGSDSVGADKKFPPLQTGKLVGLIGHFLADGFEAQQGQAVDFALVVDEWTKRSQGFAAVEARLNLVDGAPDTGAETGPGIDDDLHPQAPLWRAACTIYSTCSSMAMQVVSSSRASSGLHKGLILRPLSS